MERKKTGRLLAAFVVALVTALGLVLGFGSTARADDATYTITITNGSSTVYSNESASLNTEYTATLYGSGESATIETLDKSGVVSSVSKEGDKEVRFSVSAAGTGTITNNFFNSELELDDLSSFSVTVTKNKAPDPVKYLDANDEEQTCTEYTTITNETTGTLTGWCVVSGKAPITPTVYFNGDTHIILCDGAELNVEGLEPSEYDGASPNLTIYAQSTGSSMGKLVSKIADGTAGITASTLTINGGVIEAEGNASGLNGYTSVIINGGNVTCSGDCGISAGSVKINGGTVTMAGSRVCIYAYGEEEDPLTIADGITLIAGDDEASAQPVADPSTWAPSKKWARTTAPVPVPVTGVELDQTTATLEVGKTATLKATVKPDDANDKSVTWTSSDEKVATVKDGVVTAVAEGKATITATSVANPEASAECVVTVKAAPKPEPEPTPEPTPTGTKEMYRLYNPNSGEHFFTSNAGERDNVKVAGWTYEGVGWVAPADGAPVYRLYNENGGEHHFTTSKNEHDVLVGLGWKDEGIGWRTADASGVPVYRQYNPNAFANNHNFTVSTNERDTLIGLGWKDENVAWYGARVLK